MRKYVSVLLLATALAGCAANSNPPANGVAVENVAVQVRNDAFWDATIYLEREATARTRLGIATGNATTTFKVPRATVSSLSQIRFVIDWIGRTGREVSESIAAAPGDTIQLQIRE
jgi:hypothetical protein